MPTSSKATITPAQVNVMPGLGQDFEFAVDGKTIMPGDVIWTINDENKNVGKVGPDGRFTAYDPPRDSWGKVKGTWKDDKSVTAEATVNILINWGTMNQGPVLVDNWSAPTIPGMLWNDPRGRRGWLVMMDILYQLAPTGFLGKVGNIAMVRSKETFGKGKDSPSLHWPFDRKAIILANNFFDKDSLDMSSDFSANDFFAQVFFHELCHCVLANKAFGSGDRFFHALYGALSWPTLWFYPLTFSAAAILSPVSAIVGALTPANRDFLSDYADVGGWVVNGMHWNNPLLGFLSTQSPDVVTGLKLVGSNPLINLHNTKLPQNWIPKDLLKAGFPDNKYDRYYPGTDVHEDWACSLTYLAFNPDWQTKLPEFAPRAEFFYKNKIWKPGVSLTCGGYLNKWAIANPSLTGTPGNPTLPDATKWAVSFGPYAGKTTKSAAKAPSKSKSSKSFPFKQAQKKMPDTFTEQSVDSAATNAATDSAEDEQPDDESYLGEGGELSDEENPFKDDIDEHLQQLDTVQKYGEADAKFVETISPVYEKAIQQISALPNPPADGSALAFLRTAEGYGNGVTFLAAHPEYKFQAGDFAISSSGDLWMVVEADANGAVTKAAFASAFGDKLPEDAAFNQKILVYAWSDDRPLRTWAQPQPTQYPDLNAALRRIILSWGDTAGEGKRDLSKPANLLAQLLDAGPINIPAITKLNEDWSLDDIQTFCDQYGDGTKKINDLSDLMPGDVVCLSKPDRLGVVLDVQDDSKTLEVLVNGGDGAGLVGEEEDSAKIVHTIKASQVVWLWRPSSNKRG